MDKTQQIDELDSQVVARILGRDVTRGELNQAFARVENLTHWKNPIDAYVVITKDGELETILEAIVFFTGSRGRVELVRRGSFFRSYRIRAAGYFQTIGA